MGAIKITGQSAEPTVTASDAGTVYYDTDTNKLRFYNGSAWADVYPNQTGDVVSVADGGTTIQTDAVDIAMLSATGTASGTTFLRGDNAWATPSADLPAGTVLQVQSDRGFAEFTSDTEAWDTKITDLATLITPSHEDNRILLFGTVAAESPSGSRIMLDFYKSYTGYSTYNLTGKSWGMGMTYAATTAQQTVVTIPLLDTAGTTNEITYSISFRGLYDGYTVYAGNDTDGVTTLIALEIKV